MISIKQTPVVIGIDSMAAEVKRLGSEVEELWWSTDTSFPELERIYSERDQRTCEQQLARLLDGLERGLKRAPADEAGRSEMRQTILDESFKFIQSTFGIEDRELEMVRRNRLIEQVEEFAAMARRYDPAISSQDIYQASRNVSSVNLMQMLLGRPIEITPAVFAYSMLYPYTDNYLDDPSISMENKRGFNQRFWNRLAGKPVLALSETEKRIWNLVEMVEGQYERAHYPQVYDSLLAIHEAQTRSLRLLRAGTAPYEADVLRISIEKGGTSVLADGFLVAGTLSKDQAAFMFKFGAFTQLMDDLEDVDADRKAGSMTIFSQCAGHYALDRLTNRLFGLGHSVFSTLDSFTAPDAQLLKTLTFKAINPLLYFSAANFSSYYNPDYLKLMEKHMPFRVRFLHDQRKKMERSRGRLISLFSGELHP